LPDCIDVVFDLLAGERGGTSGFDVAAGDGTGPGEGEVAGFFLGVFAVGLDGFVFAGVGLG
jgi:hypothetical protein